MHMVRVQGYQDEVGRVPHRSLVRKSLGRCTGVSYAQGQSGDSVERRMSLVRAEQSQGTVVSTWLRR